MMLLVFTTHNLYLFSRSLSPLRVSSIVTFYHKASNKDHTLQAEAKIFSQYPLKQQIVTFSGSNFSETQKLTQKLCKKMKFNLWKRILYKLFEDKNNYSTFQIEKVFLLFILCQPLGDMHLIRVVGERGVDYLTCYALTDGHIPSH